MGIEKKAAELAQVIQQQEHVDIITHCDADGITGAAIAKQALDRAGIQNEVRVVRYLNKQVLEETRSFAWLIDLG
ncbi:MAG TPA: DHH family phosphoesterase, partial [Thermoplasmatales archaeon]|nr:DHH family phosphoesterase [Thermoplasmatales archaeon]